MKTSIGQRIIFLAVLLLVLVPTLFPFLWMLLSSFKSQVDIISWPPKFIFEITMQNYLKVFGEQQFLRYLMNSSIVGISAVALSLLIGLPAAYSIARFGQKKLMILILIARLMPGISFLMQIGRASCRERV